MSDIKSSDIQELLETLQDSSHGYWECAEKSADPSFQARCKELAIKRGNMFKELCAVSEYSGNLTVQDADSAAQGSVSAVFHRMYVDLKAMLAKGDPKAIIKEIDRGEKLLLNTYRKTLEKVSASSQIHKLLTDQFTQIKQELDSMNASYLSVSKAV